MCQAVPMSLWVLEYRYADMDARARMRPEHLAYMTRLHASGTVVYAGPIGDGGGAMVLLRCESEDDVRRVIAEDPYTAAGVGADHTIRLWNAVMGGEPAPA